MTTATKTRPRKRPPALPRGYAAAMMRAAVDRAPSGCLIIGPVPDAAPPGSVVTIFHIGRQVEVATAGRRVGERIDSVQAMMAVIRRVHGGEASGTVSVSLGRGSRRAREHTVRVTWSGGSPRSRGAFIRRMRRAARQVANDLGLRAMGVTSGRARDAAWFDTSW